MNTLNFSYDAESDCLTIEGLKYSGEIFRKLGGAFQIGIPFILLNRKDGVVTVKAIRFEEDLPHG